MPCENHAKTMRNTRGARRRKNKARYGESLLERRVGTRRSFAMRKPCENHAKTMRKPCENIWAPGREGKKETPLLVDGGCLPTTVLPPMSMGVAGLHETPVLVHMRNSKRRAWQAFEGSRTPIAGLVNTKCNIMQGFPLEALLILILAAVW